MVLKPPPTLELLLTRSSNIYLKLETLQPSGSFKSRALGNFLQKAIASHGSEKPIHFYCASGGNAGLACVVAATMLKRPATIVVPMTTSALMIEKLKTLGADVVQIGNHWSEADAHLREELLGKDENGVYVPPFDHENIWEGNSTISDELEITARTADRVIMGVRHKKYPIEGIQFHPESILTAQGENIINNWLKL